MNPERARLRREIVAEIRDHAASEYGDECCGVVVEGPSGVQNVIRVRNIQDRMHVEDPQRYPRTARTAYAGHPADLRAALRAAEQPGHRLVAFYHSHPDHDAYFSAEDVAQATPFGEPSYPEAVQIVVSVRADQVGDTRAFAWSAEHSAYVEVPIEVV